MRRCVRNDELEAMGGEVMGELHPALLHFQIGFLLVDPPYTKGGRDLAGRASKANDRERNLLRVDGWVEIAYHHWAGEGEEWQRYLLDHELQHFEVRDGMLKTVGHDFEDFYDVLRRHAREVTGLGELERLTAPARSDGSENI